MFVSLRVADNIGDFGQAATSPATWGVVASSSVVYAVLTLPLAAAWAILLARAPGANFVSAVEVFGRFQIAKYIPGNVFHLVGRQLLGVTKGWPQGAVAVANKAARIAWVVMTRDESYRTPAAVRHEDVTAP